MTSGIALLLIVGIGYWSFGKVFNDDGAVRYALAQVQKGTLIVSISGSGQVSASNQLDIKPKVSGDVVYVGVKNGQEVKAGDLIAQIDTSDAEKAVRDAETALETAKLELDESLRPPDEYSLMQAENALMQAKDNLTKLKFTQESKRQDALDAIEKAEDNLEKAYEDGFNTVANAFLDLPTLITGLRDILYSYEISDSTIFCNSNWNISCLKNSVEYDDRYELEKFIDSAIDDYKSAREKYDENFENYKDASRYSDKEVIETLLNETLETTKAMAEVVKSETNMLDYWADLQSSYDRQIYSKVIEYQSDLKSYTSKTNSHLSSLLPIQRNLEDNKESKLKAERDLREMDQNDPLDLAAAERSVKEKEEALAKLKAGPDELDIRAKKIAIQQKEDALLDAQQNLADHYIRAPFAGVVAKVSVKKGDTASAGTAVATLVTKQKIAEISLNEIDVAKVKVGQKATLTFDALPDLTITGQIVEVDAVGTVSQGVVTYTVKIGFDTQDDRVKTAMSISAAIVTEAKPNVLLVPNSAVKSQGGISYVEIVEGDDRNMALAANVSGAILTNTPRRQQVEIGTASDEFTEIVGGLNKGDVVVTRTIQPSSQQTQAQQQGGLRIPGLPSGRGGGGSGGLRGGGGGGEFGH